MSGWLGSSFLPVAAHSCLNADSSLPPSYSPSHLLPPLDSCRPFHFFPLCSAIAVLGVDFMSENVRAILDEAGHADVAVFRMSADSIGCSLAEAAESPAYDAYLSEAGHTPNSLHVRADGGAVHGLAACGGEVEVD